MTQMRLIDIDVSWMPSWIAWRNIYTEKGGKPFGLLDMKDLEPEGEGCPLCKDMLIVRHDEQIYYCLCQVLKWEQRVRDRFQWIRTPEQPATFGSLDLHPGLGKNGVETLKKTIEKAQRFVINPKKWLLISGPYGVGKTHILRAINTHLSPIAIYISAQDVEDMIHKFRKSDELGDFYDLLMRAPILLIDDLGIEYGGNLFKSMIDRVIDGRIKRFPLKPTVIATNIPTQDIPNYIERTGDRLLNLAKVERAFIAAKSYRQIKPQHR